MLSTPLVLPASVAGALAALFVVLAVMASNIICTLPDSTLLRMSPEALCGTCTMSVLLKALNSSPAM